MLQALTNSYSLQFFGEHLEVNCLDKTERLKLEEEDERFVISSLEDNIPFLQMLQSVESPQFFPFNEPSFQTLVRLQHLKNPWEKGIPYIPKLETQSQALEFESCVTRDIVEMQSPLKSESYDLQHPHSSASCVEKVGYECNQEAPKSAEDCSKDAVGNSWHKDIIQCPKFQVGTRERRKRKRTRQTKNKEDVENQRMTHIAVERNRRRQMNEHLSVLKSLMPPSYIQRGDHASIIGGAIDFVKELEQLLQSLEAQKRMKRNEEEGSCGLVKPSTPDYGMSSSTNCGAEVKVENKLEAAAIEVTVNQKHVNLKIQCQKSRAGQLIKTIVGLEDLRLTVLHLSITSSDASVLYSFNLKMRHDRRPFSMKTCHMVIQIEEECKVGSANDIAEAIDQIFSFING